MASHHRHVDDFARAGLRVGVIGCGYVGLPLALRFAAIGHRVTGFDTDPAKVAALDRGESYIRHIPAERIAALRRAGQLDATGDFARLAQMDVVVICVPTPLDECRQPDLSYVRSTAQQVAAALVAGQLVVLESTTYPGTTDELLRPILETSGLRCPPEATATEQTDFFLAFSPEREDPGNPIYTLERIPKIVGGVNLPSRLAAEAFYRRAVARVVPVSSARAAEMTKLVENIFRCVNIAMVNELKLLALRMGLDIWEIIEAASTKPFGFMPFWPGPGLGGHCIPVDPFYLSWKAREYDFPTRFIELAGEINTAMPYHVVDAVAAALNVRRKSLCGARVLVLGVAYKRDVDDLRESPALKILQLLLARGARVDYHDPYFPRLPRTRRYDFSQLEAVEPTPERLAGYDCVLIVTDHSCYDWATIVRAAPLVVDTRNATRNITEHREKIVRC